MLRLAGEPNHRRLRSVGAPCASAVRDDPTSAATLAVHARPARTAVTPLPGSGEFPRRFRARGRTSPARTRHREPHFQPVQSAWRKAPPTQPGVGGEIPPPLQSAWRRLPGSPGRRRRNSPAGSERLEELHQPVQRLWGRPAGSVWCEENAPRQVRTTRRKLPRSVVVIPARPRARQAPTDRRRRGSLPCA